MLGEKQIVAVCGLNCAKCDIFQASSNRDLAQKIVDWFKKEWDSVVKVEDICCLGCRGDGAKHWSPDCWILKCCVDEKGLEFCFKCGDFPCEKLKEWARESKQYGEALNRLREMGRVKKTIPEEKNHEDTIERLPESSFDILDFYEGLQGVIPR